VLYEQFKFFINLYFLVVALTQLIPALRIGYLYTYWAPLVSLATWLSVKCSDGHNSDALFFVAWG